MTEYELQMIKEHIEMRARIEPYATKIRHILWKAVEELEATNEKCMRCNKVGKWRNYNRINEILAQSYKEENAELKAQIEKLLDFATERTECCDVCPMTDTCINDEGTCPYASELTAEKEAETTKKWIIEKLLKE